MRNLLDTKFTCNNPNAAVICENGTQRFVINRVPIGEKFLSANPMYTFTLDGPAALDEYVVIEYDCFGVCRTPNAFRGPFMTLRNGDTTLGLFRFDDMTIDRKSHSIIVKSPSGSFDSLDINFRIDKVLNAYLNITKLYTCKKDELPLACEKGCDIPSHNFTPVDISDKFNLAYDFDAFDSYVDSGRFFDKENVSLYGVPFKVKPDGMNLVSPPPVPSENEDIIDNFGAKCKRRICRPISRDGETVIEIGKYASEIYFILTVSGKRWLRVKYGSDPTILGNATCDISEPIKLVDVEMFMVEVVYRDGRRDTHLPLNLGTDRHGISGDINVYGVPCDGDVESLIIHNRFLDGDINLAAVTVNETESRMRPDMLIPEKPEKIAHNVGNTKAISLDGSVLTLENGALSMKLDTSRGLHLTEMANAFTPLMQAKCGALLKIRDAEGNICDTFDFVSANVTADRAKLVYGYGGAEFTVSIDISGENNVQFDLDVKNTSDAEFRKGIIFPALSVDNGSFEDNWYFLPAYQNIDSNETFFMYEESAPSFPLQFMDVYSPSMQGGLCLTTRERNMVTRKYALEKNDDGITLYVEYPIIYGDIAQGQSFSASPCLITCHDGGWKQAYFIYKEWLDSWYSPYKCQDKQWYRECFWLLAEITDFFENEDMCKFPCWCDEDTGKFHFRDILEEQKRIAGVYPDILHMWSWCYMFKDGEYRQKWGNFGDVDYEVYGGAEKFRAALHDIRDNMGVQISLYMHPTLLTETYEKYAKFESTSLVKSESGGRIGVCGDSFRMCHAEEKFRDASLAMYPRLYGELGIPLLYVDEFSLRIGNRCYADNHGHHVPSNLLRTDREYISRLKDIMPEEVVLYGEYAAADINARYIDCNISYYILDSIVDMIETMKRANDGDDRLGRVFMHTYRFLFPKIVQLILPMAMRNLSWHPQKFLFFNAEAIYDSFWDNEESRGLDFTVQAYKLKKKYADCFTSDCPETMIETESPAICMNRFPSKVSDRVVYTVYNRAYSTFRGAALKVPHKDGAVYYDAWNDKPLDYTVADGYAVINLEIGAQEIGCIVIE